MSVPREAVIVISIVVGRACTAAAVPRLRVRLTARQDLAGDIGTELVFVNETDENDEPFITTKLDRYEQAKIQVHYLPARRDPADHIGHTNVSSTAGG